MHSVWVQDTIVSGDEVEVSVGERWGTRWTRAIADSNPEFGWVCVLGIRGRAGSVSVPLDTVRLLGTDPCFKPPTGGSDDQGAG